MSWDREVISDRRVRTERGRRIEEGISLEICVGKRWFRDLVTELENLSGDCLMGRPRRHSKAVVALLSLASSVLGSQERAEIFLGSPSHWKKFSRLLRKQFPEDPLLHDSAIPPTWSVLRHYLKDIDWNFAERIHRHLEASAILEALEMKLGENRGTLLEPSRNAILFGDSVVVKALSSFTAEDYGIHPRTGQLQQRRHDPDADTHVTGDKKVVYGTSFTHISAFTGHAGEYIMFAIQPVDKSGEMRESVVALDLAGKVKSRIPGFGALSWDKALRGVHIDRCWNFGLQPVVGVYDKSGLTTEIVPLETHLVKGITVQLVSWKGAVTLLTASGDKIVLEPLKLAMQPNKDGTIRAYCTYQIPEGSPCDTRLWGQRVRQRVNSSPMSGKEIGEYVRAIPPGTKRWKNLYGNRSLAESFNSWMKNKLLPNQRARSLGRVRQWVDLILMALIRNTVCCELFKQRTKHGDPRLLVAT
jgi:hypothetical protein